MIESFRESAEGLSDFFGVYLLAFAFLVLAFIFILFVLTLFIADEEDEND